jgi:cyclohexyl-isocyanide hydratase
MRAAATQGLKVGIPLYPTFDSLDVMGPFQTFTFAQMDCYLVAETMDAVKSFEGACIQPRVTFDDCPQLDVLFVPGASDPVSALLKGHPGKNPLLDFLIRQEPLAKYVCSVCTGALLLGGARLLDYRYTATTHWAYKDVLRLFECNVPSDFRRYVQSGNRITGAGISSGLDESLYIVSLLLGVQVARRCQLSMQYHPQPIFHCGDPGDTDIQDDPGMVKEIEQSWDTEEAYKQVIAWRYGN